MATVSIIIDKRRVLENKEYPIKVKIYSKGAAYILTNASCKEQDWDANKVKSSDPRYKVKNARINNKLSQVEKELLPLELNGEINRYSAKQLKKIIEGKNENVLRAVKDYFLEYIDQCNSVRTKEIYQATITKIERFYPYTSLDDINIKWLERFELNEKKLGNSQNSTSIHLRNIRAVFNYCLDNEYTTNYPFRKFKIKQEKTAKRSLSIDDIRLLSTYQVEAHQERYRDIFMLSFYLLGINMVDLLHLTPNSVVGDRIEFRRAKTKRLYSIKIPDEAQVIIDKYRGKEYLINVMDNYSDYHNFVKQINKYLKLIGRKDIKRNKIVLTPLFPDISTYWARHTWATIASSIDISKDIIAHALGHGNDTVTDVYIDFDLKKVDEANRRVIDYVNG